jgi:hypothetical protein
MAKRSLPVIPPEFSDPGIPSGIFSPSQYSLYKKCGRAYEFRYLMGIKTPPAAVMVKGTAVHAGAELSHKSVMETGKAPLLDAVRQHVADSFQEEISSDEGKLVDWEDQKPGQVKDEAIGLYTTYHRQALPKVHPMEVESHVIGRIGAVPVHGYIDLVDHTRQPSAGGVEDPGVIVIADMKTTSTTWSEDDIKKDPQFTAYAALKGIPTVRVDNLVQLKKGPQLTQRTAIRTKQEIGILVEDYEQVVDHIKRGIFPMAPIDSWMCSARWCGYWSRCRGRKL